MTKPKFKKNHTLLYLMITISLTIPSISFSQHLQKGTKKIDFYYGGPNIWSSVKASNIRGKTEEYITDKSNIGAFGIRIESIVLPSLGVGGEFNFASSTVKWEEDHGYLENGVTKYKDFKYEQTFNRWRALLRANYYYYTAPIYHGYLTAGIGYAHYKYIKEKESIAPDSRSEDEEFSPFTFRFGIGNNFYIAKNFALSLEFGAPGPLFTLGGTIKF